MEGPSALLELWLGKPAAFSVVPSSENCFMCCQFLYNCIGALLSNPVSPSSKVASE